MIQRFKVLEKYINNEATGIYKQGDAVDVVSETNNCLNL